MTDITVAAGGFPHFEGPDPVDIEVWIMANQPFVDSGGVPYNAGTVEEGLWVVKKITGGISVDVNGALQLPQVVIPSTRDALVNSSATLSMFAVVKPAKGGRNLGVLGTFDRFIVPADPANTTWHDLALAQIPAEPVTEVPAAPVLTVTLVGNTPTLTAPKPATTTGWEIWRGTASGAEALYEEVSSAAALNWSDPAYTNGVQYFYKVKAVNEIGASPFSNEGSVTPAVPGAINPVVYDPFYYPGESANLITVPEIKPVGAVWGVAATGVVWGVKRNSVYVSTNGAGNKNLRTIESGLSDGYVNIRLSRPNAGAINIIVRQTDDNNFWKIQYQQSFGVRIQKMVAGGLSTPVAFVPYNAIPNQEFGVYFSGDHIIACVDGVLKAEIHDAFNQSATKHGLWLDASTQDANGPYVSDFTVSSRQYRSDSITLAWPQYAATFQRNKATNKGSIYVQGTYTGAPVGLEWRWGTGAFQPWTEAFGSGSFSGYITNQNVGVGDFEIRFANDPHVIARARQVKIGAVVIGAGQSNMEGRFLTRSNYEKSSVHGYRHSVQRHNNGDRWDDCIDATDNWDIVTQVTSANQNSAWPDLCGQIGEAGDVPVGFIAVGHGQTGLIGSGGTWAPNQVTFNECKNAVLGSKAGGCELFLWFQGEQDAVITTMTKTQYMTAFQNMVTAMEAALGFPLSNIVTCGLAYMHSAAAATTETRSSLDAVRLGLIDALGIDANVPLYDLDNSEAAGGDGIHLTTAPHQTILADRAARIANFVMFGTGQGLAPKVASVTKVNATTIDVQFTMAAGRSLLVGASPLIGWRVVDDGGVKAVSAAVVQSANTIRLTVAALTTNVKVSFASYNDGLNATVTDDGTVKLPILPFVDVVAA